MTQPKVFNSLNASERPKVYLDFKLTSLTVPDEALSMRQIMDRYSRGIDIGGAKEPIFDEDEIAEGVNPKTLDLVDIQDRGDDFREALDEYQIKTAKKAALKAAKEAEQKAKAAEQKVIDEFKAKQNLDRP